MMPEATLEQERDGGYDAFISYSHAGDDLVAARLQNGLQRFAKPWWKRRAIRVFRDESSLAANPHLWSSITDALDASSWLVVLLSPDAAGSEWVNREVEYWLANRPADRIILVLTEGELAWSESGLESDAVPPALTGVFSGEPRWVDLRFARIEEQLDLKNPRFSAAVADVASALRGIPKEELESEEVRQHRRAVRTAWAAGLLIGVLGVVSVVFGVRAASEAERANANAADAEAQRELAVQARIGAEDAAAQAKRNERFALQKAAVAEAGRYLEIAATHPDPAVVVSLTLYAVALAGDEVAEIEPQVVPLLNTALPEYRAVGDFFDLGDGYAAISADGNTVFYVNQHDLHVSAIDTKTRAVKWRELLLRADNSPDPLGLFVVADGNRVAVPIQASGAVRVFVLATDDDGALEGDFVVEKCPEVGLFTFGGIFSADGRYLTMRVGCGEGAASNLLAIYEIASGTELAPRIEGVEAHFSSDSSVVLVLSDEGPAQLFTFPDLELLKSFPGEYSTGALSPTANLVALGASNGDVHIFDREGVPVHRIGVPSEIHSHQSPPISFSPDESLLAVATRRSDFVFDVDSGSQIAAFNNGETWLHSWTADGDELFIDPYTLWSVRDQIRTDPLRISLDDLLDTALSVLERGFLDGDCDEFRIEHCPLTADELRSMVEASRAISSN
ncbi:MAG: TIR domain-containing protein [Acidimicrobiia bacterium]|nr:TIR domain-containing protein [Acidimicrobiia bacterium]